MKNDLKLGPVLLALHDTEQRDVLVPLDNIAVVYVAQGSTQIVLKEPRGAAHVIVTETPAEVQSIITQTIISMIAGIMKAYTHHANHHFNDRRDNEGIHTSRKPSFQ